MEKRIHVTQRHDGTWQAKREQAARAGSVHDSQAEAIEAARETAQRERGEVVIHDRRGRIRDADSYGRDPNPPKDMRH